MANCKWYHGDISRQDTVDRLTKHGMVGAVSHHPNRPLLIACCRCCRCCLVDALCLVLSALHHVAVLYLAILSGMYGRGMRNGRYWFVFNRGHFVFLLLRFCSPHSQHDGLFLVRKRGTEHVLCVAGNDRVCNFLIKNKAGGYSIGQDAPLFHSLVDLTEYFRTYQGGLPSVLLAECPSPAGGSVSSANRAAPLGADSDFGVYDAPSGKKKKLTPKEKKLRKQLLAKRREQQLQEQLASLSEYTPYWSRGMAALMGIIMIVELAQGGVAKVALQSAETTESMTKNMSSRLYAPLSDSSRCAHLHPFYQPGGSI